MKPFLIPAAVTGLVVSIILSSCSHSPSSDREPASALARPQGEQSGNILDESWVPQCSPMDGIGCSGMFVFHPGEDSRIGLLTNGERAFAARLKTIQKARQSIRIQALVFKGDESGRLIAKILREKKRAGLDVRVIVDAFSNPEINTQKMYYELKRAGIEVEGYETGPLVWMHEVSTKDPARPDKRFHEKMWIVDAEDPVRGVAITGGMNIANEYFRAGSDPSHIWRDQDFIVRGALVKDMADAFDGNYVDQKRLKARLGAVSTDNAWKLWRKHVVGKFGELKFDYKNDPEVLKKLKAISRQYRDDKFETEASPSRFIRNRPRYGETYIRQAYEQLFASAREELLVVNAYFIPEARMRAGLMAAARRGVKVTILTNSAKTNDLPQMAYASRYLYKELLSVNEDARTKANGGSLAILEWNGHLHGEGTIHAKFAVADRKLIIGGSYNLDARSELLNSENVIYFENAELGAELARVVIEKDFPKCEEITPRQAHEFHNPKHPPDMIQLLLWNGLKGEL